MTNRVKYVQQQHEYVDELPDTAAELVSYGGYSYDRYWYDYDTDRIIVRTCNRFKYVNVTSSGSHKAVHLFDVFGNGHVCGWNKLVRTMYDRVE